MSSDFAIKYDQFALNTIENFAHTLPTAACVVTKELQIRQPWGWIKKFFLQCFLNGYYRAMNPTDAIQNFKQILWTVCSSDDYPHNPELRQRCKKACETFNHLILNNLKEIPSRKRIAKKTLQIQFKTEELSKEKQRQVREWINSQG